MKPISVLLIWFRLLIWLIAAALDDRQDGVFAKARIGFGEAAHDKKAASGAFDNFDVPAGGAEADRWGNLHGASLAQSWCSAKDDEMKDCLHSI
jgi:hypothetical protein